MKSHNFLVMIGMLMVLQSCLEAGSDEASVFQIRQPVQAAPDEVVTFEMLKSAIFDNQCLVCHAWAGNEQAVRTRIVPGQPERSRVYLRVEDGSMPIGGPELTLEQLDLLRRYIMELQ